MLAIGRERESSAGRTAAAAAAAAAVPIPQGVLVKATATEVGPATGLETTAVPRAMSAVGATSVMVREKAAAAV